MTGQSPATAKTPEGGLHPRPARSGAPQRIVRVGCSGWNYAHWRNGAFYPPRCPARLWLEYYSRFFETVEVNATFYRLPTVKAVQGWVDQTRTTSASP
ncbi:MAG: DUF72 domain-containing protein [Actinobacteria bacterium]|nr:DUF72 domain-containing protein [Actinomycetota bacterium]